jgi:hypothetical protein
VVAYRRSQLPNTGLRVFKHLQETLNNLPENDIPEPILRSIFTSDNIALANAEHRTNITAMRKPAHHDHDSPTPIIETSGLIDFDGIDVNTDEMMTNAVRNLHGNLYLSYTHDSTMANEYNNPALMTGMFPTLFPYEMSNGPRKTSLGAHVKHLSSLPTHY